MLLFTEPEEGTPGLVPLPAGCSQALAYRRGELVVIVHRQPIYGLPTKEAERRKLQPLTAELPPSLLESYAASARP